MRNFKIMWKGKGLVNFMVCDRGCDKGLRNKLCSLSWQPASEKPTENCLSLGGYCCWVRFALTVLFLTKRKKGTTVFLAWGCVCTRNKHNKCLIETYGKITQIQPGSALECVYPSLLDFQSATFSDTLESNKPKTLFRCQTVPSFPQDSRILNKIQPTYT